MAIEVETIPARMRAMNQWLCWKSEVRNGRTTKVPVSVDGKRAGDSTDPNTWGSFEDALYTMSNEGLSGVGFVFSREDDFVGIDLDGCIQDNVVEPWAQELIDRFDTYTERTPSGKGFHLILRGELPPHGRRRGNIEVYAEKRFFTVTGDRMHGGDVEDRRQELARWHLEIFGEEIGPAEPPSGAGFEGDDTNLIARACASRNGSKFHRLWEGDLSDYEGDHSAADMGLCSMLAFWAGGDTDRIDRIFRQSKLYRAKWDEKRGEHTYGQRTIQQAMNTCREFYSPGMADEEIASQLDRMQKREEDQNTPAARPYVTNVVSKETEDGDNVAYYVDPTTISRVVVEGTGGWPRSAAGMMFARRDRKEDDGFTLPDHNSVRYLRNTNALHAWLHEVAALHFAKNNHAWTRHGKKVSPITKPEFFETLSAFIERYEAVEMLPHHPQVNGIYYWPCELPASDGSALKELLDNLNPDTEEDRGLMLAALMTPGWGGPPGARPAFVFTSTHGRGSGKTATAELFAQIWGGQLSVAEDEDWQQVKTRLLSDDSFAKRCILIDNLKGRLSRSGLESAITASTIDGKRMYVGQASRPNLLTWYITANTPELSRDLAERSIIINVGAPNHKQAFKEWTDRFLEEKRPYVLADLLALLQGEAKAEIPPASQDRWQLWQRSVLAKLDNGAELARTAIDKRPSVDTDRGTAEDVSSEIRTMLEERGVDPDHEAMVIPAAKMHERLVDAGLRDKGRMAATTQWLKHHLDIEPLKTCLRYQQARINGQVKRGWVWRGPSSAPDLGLSDIPVYMGNPEQEGGYDGFD